MLIEKNTLFFNENFKFTNFYIKSRISNSSFEVTISFNCDSNFSAKLLGEDIFVDWTNANKLKFTNMNLRKFLAIIVMMIITLSATSAQAQSLSPSTKWHWEKGTIVVDTPERATGQQHALNLAVAPIKNLRVAFVGLGMRGPWAVWRFSAIPGVEIVALCDYEYRRAEKCQKYLREQGLMPADIYYGEYGYKAICERNDIDLVYIATDWNHHFPIAKYAMECGKHTAIEVPSAMNLADLYTVWQQHLCV